MFITFGMIVGEVSRDFYSTLCSVSATVVSIVITFVIAYMIYSKGKRDDLSIKTKEQLQYLNNLFYHFSQLEEYPRPEQAMDAGYYIQIMQNESWKESPEGIFKKEVDNITNEFQTVVQKFFKENFLVSAILNKVKFALHDLMMKIYLELPSPPGVVRHKDKATYFERFIKDNFPDVQKEFEVWSERFLKFYQEIMRIYFYDLTPIIGEIKKTAKKDIERGRESLEQLRRIGKLDDFIKDSLEKSEEYSISSANYYENFFLALGRIRD